MAAALPAARLPSHKPGEHCAALSFRFPSAFATESVLQCIGFARPGFVRLEIGVSVAC